MSNPTITVDRTIDSTDYTIHIPNSWAIDLPVDEAKLRIVAHIISLFVGAYSEYNR